MAAQYAGADLVLFPSTFEGFGLPIVEVREAGHEAGHYQRSQPDEGDGGRRAACLADPYDIASAIRQAVIRVIGGRCLPRAAGTGRFS